MDFETRYEAKVRDFEEAMEEPLNKHLKAHYFLKKLRVGGDKESQIITGAGNELVYEKLRDSSKACIPRVSMLRNRAAAPFNGANREYLNRNRRRLGKPLGRGGARKVHATENAEAEAEREGAEAEGPSTSAEEDDDDEEPDSEVDAGVDPNIAENELVPEELQAYLTENEVLMTQAKKARAEAEKARDFYRGPGGRASGGRGADSERIRKLKLTLPCKRCGRLGHWKDDPECPRAPGKASTAGKAAGAEGKGTRVVARAEEPAEREKEPAEPAHLDGDCPGEVDNGVKITRFRSEEEEEAFPLCLSPPSSHLQAAAGHPMSVLVAETGDAVWLIVVDTACAKSVAGLRWHRRLAIYVRENWGIELETVTEREPYRFGPGKAIYSSQALLLPMEWDGKGAVIRISLVEEDVPPLISGGALKALEAHIHVKEAEITLGALSKARHKLRELPSGHLAMAAVSYGPGGPGAGAQEAVSRCRAGAEITLYGRVRGSPCEAVRRALYTDPYGEHEQAPSSVALGRARGQMPPWRPTVVQCRSGAARASAATRLVFMAWRAWYQELLVDYLEREVLTLRQREDTPRSIWEMRKAELVTLAMQRLGWQRARAEAETAGQLRLVLREKKDEIQASEVEKDDPRTTLPTGLTNMKLAQLQEEAAVRQIPLTRSNGADKRREELIRDVRLFVSEAVERFSGRAGDAPGAGSHASTQAAGGGKQGRGSARNRRLKGPTATAVRKACLGIASAWLLGVATLGTWLEETGGGQWARHRWGTDRVDVVEFFGGGSDVSRIGSKNGWWCLRPWDAKCGADLARESEQAEALGMLSDVRPRLAVVELHGSSVGGAQRGTHQSNADQQRQRAERRRQRSLMEFTRKVFEVQAENGGCALVRNESAIHAVEALPSVEVVKGGLCVRGVTGQPAWWATNCPEIAAVLWRECSVVHERRSGVNDKATSSTGRHSLALGVLRGLKRHLTRAEPERIGWRGRLPGTRPSGQGRSVHEGRATKLEPGPASYPSGLGETDSGNAIPQGITFKFPDTPMGKSLAQRMTPELRRNLRRLHLNTGHASPEDLARLVAKAGGSEVAVAGATALRCSSCAERPRARPPRPARLREDDLSFNEVVQADLFKIPDQWGTGWWFLLVQDVATGHCTIGLINAHSSEELWGQYERLWLCWAGPPDQFVTDNERGLVSGSFVDALSRSGAARDPTAAYAPWQKGKVERKIQEAKNVMKKSIRHALNHFPGQCGYSPSLLLFGQKMKFVGECWHEGKAVSYHPCVAEEGDPLARRLKIREHCQQSLIKTRSQELVRRAVAARSRGTPAEWKEGERVFFFRPYRTERGRRVNEPEWCGPALVFGRRNDNVWVQYGGKPFLVAPEHLRPLSPEEQHLAEDADLARSLDEIRQAMSREEFEDLTGLNAGPDELAAADGLVQGEASEQEREGPGDGGVVEVDPPAPGGTPREEARDEAQGSGLPRGVPRELERFITMPGWHVCDRGCPVRSLGEAWARVTLGARFPLEKWPLRTTYEKDGGEWRCTEHRVRWAQLTNPRELLRPAADRMLVVFEEEKKRQREPTLATVEGPAAVRRTGEAPSGASYQAHQVMTAYHRGTGSALLDRKTQDRELKWDEIAPKDHEAFQAAVEKEWDSWLRYKCVSVLEPEASQEVLWTVDRSRILGSDMKLKDKNAALRTPENDLPLKAKARLCVQGQHDPDAKLGTVKTDAPTVQRSGFHAFLQQSANLGWLSQLAIGMLIVHVGDCMLAHDGSAEMRAKEARLRERFPFGSWTVVAQQAEGDVYTGRRIRVDGSCVEVGMPEFVEGRLEEVKVDRQAKGEDPVSPLAKAEFQSATGSLHWLASQCRLDKAYETNRFQKLQKAPTWSDARELNKCIRDVKASGGARLRIAPIKGRMGVGCWHDSSLYGNVSELIEGDEDLKRFDRHKVRSQAGVVVAAIDLDCLEQDELPISILDWRSRASHRVVTSTFSAETAARLEGHGMAYYMRALLCEATYGWSGTPVVEYGEDEMPLALFTDCRSLYDHVKVEGNIPDDRRADAMDRGASGAGSDAGHRSGRRGKEAPRRGEEPTAQTTRSRSRGKGEEPPRRGEERRRSPAEPAEPAEPARVERRATPPKRTGCGDGGGPVCFTRRHLGGDGESIESYPSEHAALKTADHFMVFTQLEVDQLPNSEWSPWVSNFLRVAYPGALVPGKDSAEELACRWNNVVHQDGLKYKRWALVMDLLKTYPLAATHWQAAAQRRLMVSIPPPAASARDANARDSDSDSEYSSDEKRAAPEVGAEARAEVEHDERSCSARRARAEEDSEGDDGSSGRRSRRPPRARSPSPEAHVEEHKGGKGSKGDKGKKGKGSKGEKGKGTKGGKSKKGPLPGSIPSEVLNPNICRLCFKEGHWGNQCPVYYQDGTPKEGPAPWGKPAKAPDTTAPK
ncbi:unnamed protein product [Prorocentrum cordatum]|uniref:Integrase catalytic domain-containing protein n=1 Tax=Prorocentrum cordatum TaxID=2364126 RepID=A0ABN9S3A9_9DINO|nr:unnamed protein product [Polarella glacialis]